MKLRHGVAATALLALCPAAWANTITVNGTTIGPGVCTLPLAVDNANGSPTNANCSAGSGSDIIQFAGAGFGTTTLLSTLTVSRALTINGSSGVVIDAGGVPAFSVSSGAALGLQNLSVIHGDGADSSHGSALTNAGTVALTSVLFDSNAGNAILNQSSGDLIGDRLVFSGNGGSGTSGGAAILNKGDATVAFSLFEGNDGGSVAPAAIDNQSGGTTLVLSSTFDANTGTPGVTRNAATMKIVNSTFFRDASSGSGVVATTGGTTTIVNATLSGDAISTSSGATTSLSNTLIAGNATDCSGTGTVSNVANNHFDSGCGSIPAAGGTLGLDPALGDHGGPALPTGDVLPTLALTAGSSSIDAGSDTVCNTALTGGGAGGEDERGFPRPHGAHCDIGAFEFGASAPHVSTGGAGGGALDTDLLLGMLMLAGLRRRRGR